MHVALLLLSKGVLAWLQVSVLGGATLLGGLVALRAPPRCVCACRHPIQLRSAQIRSDQLSSDQISSDQISSDQLSSAQGRLRS